MGNRCGFGDCSFGTFDGTLNLPICRRILIVNVLFGEVLDERLQSGEQFGYGSLRIIDAFASVDASNDSLVVSVCVVCESVLPRFGCMCP
jgi:hypothetical protein